MKGRIAIASVVSTLVIAGCGDSETATGTSEASPATVTQQIIAVDSEVADAFGTCSREWGTTETNPLPDGFLDCLREAGVPEVTVQQLTDVESSATTGETTTVPSGPDS